MDWVAHYNPWLVALSYVIAALGSYVSLALHPARVAAEEAPPSGIIPSAAALGLGIWGMHFTGMAACHFDGVQVGYRWDLTALSLVVAIAFTAIGFATLWLLPGAEGPLIAGIPMAAGILSMHFLGMMAITGDLYFRYRSDLVLAAGAIALFASIAALSLSMIPSKRVGKVCSSLVMAVAICGMHYTGMAAAVMVVPAAR